MLKCIYCSMQLYIWTLIPIYMLRKHGSKYFAPAKTLSSFQKQDPVARRRLRNWETHLGYHKFEERMEISGELSQSRECVLNLLWVVCGKPLTFCVCCLNGKVNILVYLGILLTVLIWIYYLHSSSRHVLLAYFWFPENVS